MIDESLVRVNIFSSKIKELSVTKRIVLDYPIYVRETVARKLANVAQKLPSHLQLQIDSGFRDTKTEKVLWKVRLNATKRSHPELSTEEVYELTSSLVQNPAVSNSSHSTGGAVDVSLLNAAGDEINLSEPFANYYDEPKLTSSKISKSAQELRFLLNNLMLSEGFAPNDREYWHFSYGSQTWADYYGTNTVYQTIDLGREKYFSLFYRFWLRVYVRLLKLVKK